MATKLLQITLALILLTSCVNNNKATTQNFVAGDSTVNNIPPEDTLRWTEIQWLDTTQQLGTLKSGGLVEVTYRFKNVGTKPLSINSVIPGCGCTQAQKPSSLVQPGKEGAVKAKFNTENQSGTVNKHITVTYNTKLGVRELNFTATVNP